MTEIQKEFAEKYMNTFATLRNIINKNVNMLAQLQNVNGRLSEAEQANWNHTFGASETINSVATKLVNTIHKLMAMESKVTGVDLSAVMKMLPNPKM